MGMRLWLRARWVAWRAVLSAESGFTLVETVVAGFILVVGVLGTLMMVDTATSKNASARAREGATNVAREVLEYAHDTSFGQLGSSGWMTSTLQGLSGGSGTVTSPSGSSQQTVVTRRGYAYTTTVSWCSVDDGRDGYAVSHSGSISWCSDSSTLGSGDSQPEDFKRVIVDVNWSSNGKPQPTVRQVATFGPTGGTVAPAVTGLALTTPNIPAPGPYVIVSNSPTPIFTGTSAGAADMRFAVNGVEAASGVVNNGNGTWDYTWPISS